MREREINVCDLTQKNLRLTEWPCEEIVDLSLSEIGDNYLNNNHLKPL